MNDKTPLRELKGVGEKTEKLFQKIGITTAEELLRYYPRTYDIYEEPVEIASAEEDKTVSIRATIATGIYINQIRNLQVLTTTVADASGRLPVAWFNAPYLRGTLKKGSVFILRGKIIRKKGRPQMEHPEIFTPAAYEEIIHSMQPVYGLTKGLSNKMITKLVHQILDTRPLHGEYLPEEIRERYQLADANYAIRTVHFPKNMQELLTARKRLVFDEFLLFVLAIQLLKEKTEEAPNTFPMKPVWTTEEIIEGLPYDLTGAQKNVWHEIERDLSGHKLMSRLVQGDVGSGKTILAFLIMAKFAHEGYQTAIMAPTEVLARQHYDTFQKWIAMFELDFPVILLTGSLTTKEKREAYARMETEQNAMIIGTHALIQEKALYQKLALVVTDEQHRFGVRQRETLADKSSRLPHVLVMSATPIPRTLAIILYGDLDISVVDELPAERLPVKNCVVGPKMREKSWNFILDEVQKGHQAYIICPLVEANEELELQDVTSYVKKLEQYYGDRISVGLLHGKMRPVEKNKVMEAFVTGEIQVLVSTTVVEVGVNVPNATVMMIEDAQRFGLAQLHQLRGRGGRGNTQSYCILMNSSNGKNAKERLNILAGSNDGFYIASEDLKMRGPGDFFGVRQSGLMEFKIADVFSDADMLSIASEEAKEYVEKCNLNDCEKDMRLEKTLKNAYKMAEYNINI